MSEKERRYTEESQELRVPPHSEILNQVAEEVDPSEITSPEVQDVIDTLFRVAYGRQGGATYATLVGLSAPQIGISKRIALIGMNIVQGGDQPELKAFINPVIPEQSDETEEGREGCFSTGNVWGIVRRPKWVTIQAYDQHGQLFVHRFEGFPARVALHELGHLDGLRFPDLIEDDSKLHWVEEHEVGEYRKHWHEWPALCPRGLWEAIKSGEAA
jgi:peptide deformylase